MDGTLVSFDYVFSGVFWAIVYLVKGCFETVYYLLYIWG
jgi:hypothetical protein